METSWQFFFKESMKTNRLPSLKLGEFVRIAKVFTSFSKGCKPQFTDEIFKVIHNKTTVSRVSYELEDLNGEKILGKFYPEDPHFDLYVVSVKSPFGGLIGVDDSRLERIFSFSKIMRMHAVLHDTPGFTKRYSNEGPGYIYVLGKHAPKLLNRCFFGHITGVFYCWFLKIVDRKFFKSFDVWSSENRK